MFFKKCKIPKEIKEVVDLTPFLNKQVIIAVEYGHGTKIFEAIIVAIAKDNSAYKIKDLTGPYPQTIYLTDNNWLDATRYPITEIVTKSDLTCGTG